MSSKFPYIVVAVGLIAGVFIYFNQNKLEKKPESVVTEEVLSVHEQVTTAPKPVNTSSEISVFVPTWAAIPEGETFSEYDRLIYFGVRATPEGIAEDDSYAKFKSFTELVSDDIPVWITVKMIDTDVNGKILNDTKSWEVIAEDTISLVKEQKVKGVVLDLEMAALASDGLVSRITDFIKTYNTRLEQQKIPLAVAIYGDVYYRRRPFNVVEIGKVSDEVMIMAYDFHKSYGEPGPNFPLHGKDIYGYDFTTMITNFVDQVPPEKLTVIFGMYGYDWLVDEQKRPIRPASAVTLHEVRDQFIESCEKKNCVSHRDEVSGETEVNYIDESANFHIVWFEDEQSIARKREVMKQKGIVNISHWAYGYY